MSISAKRVKPTTGIDIGAGYLKMVDSDGSKITGARIVALPDNLMRDGHVVSHELLVDILREAKPTHKDCGLMLYSTICYSRRVTMPAMTTKELMLNLPYEFQDFIHDNGEKQRFDYAMLEMRNDESGNPVEMDLLAAVVDDKTMQAYSQCFKKAGLHLKAAAPDVMALTNIVRKSPFPEDDFCFVSVGTSSTRVYLFPKGRYEAVRTIEFGTNDLARAVARERNIEFNLARTHLLANYEDCQTLPAVLEACDAFATEIQRIVNFFNFSYRDSSLERVFYGGTASTISPLLDSVADRLTIPLLGVTTLLDCAEGVDKDVLLRCPLAAGMALA